MGIMYKHILLVAILLLLLSHESSSSSTFVVCEAPTKDNHDNKDKNEEPTRRIRIITRDMPPPPPLPTKDSPVFTNHLNEENHQEQQRKPKKKKFPSVFGFDDGMHTHGGNLQPQQQQQQQQSYAKSANNIFPPSFLLSSSLNMIRPKSRHDEEKALQKSLSQFSSPLSCFKSPSLEKCPYFLKYYGNVEDNWCELITTPMVSSSSSNAAGGEASSPSSSSFNSQLAQCEKYRSAFSKPSNGGTYFDYEPSSSGKNWSHYICPVKHRIKCQRTNHPNYKQNEGRNRALVIFVVTSTNNPYQKHEETVNFNFFVEHGLIPAETPTALFDAVDFVFAKIQLGDQKTDEEFLECGTLDEAASSRQTTNQNKNKNENKNDTTSTSMMNNSNHSSRNVRFVMVPRSPCDLCAQSLIMRHLGLINATREDPIIQSCRERGDTSVDCLYENENFDVLRNLDAKNTKYSQVFLMNNGVRGPFFNSADDYEEDDDEHKKNDKQHPKTYWVDFVAAAGRRKFPNPRAGFFNHHIAKRFDHQQQSRQSTATSPSSSSHSDREARDCPLHVLSSVSINWDHHIHSQSFFLGVPMELLRQRLYPLLAATCPSKYNQTKMKYAMTNMTKINLLNFQREIKWHCIKSGELATSSAVLEYGSRNAIYSLSKQLYVHDTTRDSLSKKTQFFIPQANPTTSWMDPCKATFVKTGGDVFISQLLNERTLEAVDVLTKGAVLKNKELLSMRSKRRRMNRKNKGDQSGNNHEDNDNHDTDDDLMTWNPMRINRMFQKRGCDWRL